MQPVAFWAVFNKILAKKIFFKRLWAKKLQDYQKKVISLRPF